MGHWAWSRQLPEVLHFAGRTAMLSSFPEDLQFKIISELGCKQCAQLVLLSKERGKLVQKSWSTLDVLCDKEYKLGAIDYLANHCSQVLRRLTLEEDMSKSRSVVFQNTGELSGLESTPSEATTCGRLSNTLLSIQGDYSDLDEYSYSYQMIIGRLQAVGATIERMLCQETHMCQSTHLLSSATDACHTWWPYVLYLI